MQKRRTMKPRMTYIGDFIIRLFVCEIRRKVILSCRVWRSIDIIKNKVQKKWGDQGCLR